jgi:hypothetical protein
MTKRPPKPQNRPSLPRFKKTVLETKAAQSSSARIFHIAEVEMVTAPTPPATPARASPVADIMGDTIPSIYPQWYSALGRAIAAGNTWKYS